MSKKQVTIQLSPKVLDAVIKEHKKTKRPKQVVIDERLKVSYGIA